MVRRREFFKYTPLYALGLPNPLAWAPLAKQEAATNLGLTSFSIVGFMIRSKLISITKAVSMQTAFFLYG